MAERRIKKRRIDDHAKEAEWYVRLHRLWTWAVGKEGYNKKEWQGFEQCLMDLKVDGDRLGG